MAGFIDVKTRSDLTLPLYPRAESRVHQGITTELTGASASALGLKDRGVLRPGAAADLVVFDPASIAERGNYEEPRRYPAGVGYVIVNGALVIDSGAHTGALPGRVLRRTAAGVA